MDAGRLSDGAVRSIPWQRLPTFAGLPSKPRHDLGQHRPRAIFVRPHGLADMDEAYDFLIRLHTKPVEHITVEGEPACQPAGAVAERGCRGDDIHGAGAGRELLLPRRHLWMRLGEAHDRDHEWRIGQALPLDFEISRAGLRVLPGKHSGDDFASALPRVALEDDKAPGRKLAMIGHPRTDGEDRVEFGGRGARTGHLARLHRTAGLQEFYSVGHDVSFVAT